MNRNTNCLISILSMLLLSDCATSTQELIELAPFTGDWTHVNNRLDATERREAQSKQTCPPGTKLWCVSRIRNEGCSCVSDAYSGEMIESLWEQ
jgi:hypothetical protein